MRRGGRGNGLGVRACSRSELGRGRGFWYALRLVHDGVERESAGGYSKRDAAHGNFRRARRILDFLD